MNQYKSFLHMLKRDDNTNLVECIEEGYNAIFEGYCDVRPDPSERQEDTVSRFNRNAARSQAQIGSFTLSKLVEFADNSKKINWTFDDESDLDNNSTSPFANRMQLDEIVVHNKKSSDLGDVGMPTGGF